MKTDNRYGSISLYGAILRVVLFAAAVVFAFWRCRYGFACKDECYAIAIPYRFCMGDIPIVDEWALQQFAGLLIFPVLKVWLWISGGTEGVVLAFRHFFVFAAIAAGIFQYFRWRRFGEIGAFAGLLFFVTYAPFGITTLAYNTMDVLCASVAITLYATFDRRAVVPMFFSGVFFCAVVMCCPQLVLGYVVYTIWALYRHRSREWVCITLGIAALATPYLALTMYDTSIRDIIASIPLMLQDPEHPVRPLWLMLCEFAKNSLTQQRLFSAVAYVLFAVVALVSMNRAKRKGGVPNIEVRRSFLLLGLLVMVVLAIFASRAPTADYLAYPVCVIALWMSLLSVCKHEVSDVAIMALVPAFALGFFTCLGCNTGSVRVSIVMVCALIPALSIISSEAYDERRCRCALCWRIMCVASLVLLLSANFYFRVTNVFCDAAIPELTTRITYGPQKGIYCSEGAGNGYDAMNRMVAELAPPNSGKSVLFTHQNTDPYLSSMNRYGTYTAWATGSGHAAFDRLKKYWDLHRDRMPDVVVFNREDDDMKSDFESMGYQTVLSDWHYPCLVRRQ